MYRSVLLSCLIAFGAGVPVAPQATPTFSTDVNVVNILATVRDRKGQIIQDLTKDDFQLTEDKRPQIVRYFSKESDLPLTIALLVDTSMSQERVLPEERKAAGDFLRSNIRARNDDELIVTFDTVIRLLPEINALSVPEDRKTGTLLNDAVYSICDQKLASRHGRKIMIILSDGVDYGSRANVDQAIARAIRADVVIYAILFSDASFYGSANAGPYSTRYGAAAMKAVATATGGSYLEVTKEHSVEQMFDHIAEDLHHQYSLGFTSDRPATKREVRKLDLATKRWGLVVQARKWYVAQP